MDDWMGRGSPLVFEMCGCTLKIIGIKDEEKEGKASHEFARCVVVSQQACSSRELVYNMRYSR